jgi:hypothetical protein
VISLNLYPAADLPLLRTTTVSAQAGDYEVNSTPMQVTLSGASAPSPQERWATSAATSSKTPVRTAINMTAVAVTQIVLRGANYQIKGQRIYIPSFAAGYSDTELAAVANYVIAHFGGTTGRVTPEDVAKLRRE